MLEMVYKNTYSRRGIKWQAILSVVLTVRMFDKLIYKQFGSWLKLINSWIRGRPSFSLIAIERNSEVAIYKKEINIVWCL